MNRLTYWLAALAINLALGACAARESAETDQSAEQKRRGRAAAAICREQFGHEALVEWISDDAHVCRRGLIL